MRVLCCLALMLCASVFGYGHVHGNGHGGLRQFFSATPRVDAAIARYAADVGDEEIQRIGVVYAGSGFGVGAQKNQKKLRKS